MINKIYKIINNRFSRFFKFVFFIRYLFAIFFVAIILFLFIPQLFDYKKKEEIIKVYLLKNYGLKINKIGNIRFNSFPIPYLEIDNLTSNFFSNSENLKTHKLTIYPKLLSIYNYDNFKATKVILEKNDITLDFDNIQFLFKQIFSLKNKLFLKNLNLKVKDKKIDLINLSNINLSNYGYKKNIVEGNIFNKKFIVNINENLNNISFKLLNTGISTTFKILENNKDEGLIGSLKGKILKSNFKLNFIYNDSLLKIDNFYLRDKNLYLDNKGVIELSPYFFAKLDTEIKNLNSDILRNLDIITFLKYNFLIKRINSENNITFKSKKFSRDLIEDLKMKINLTYGRLDILKNFNISKSKFSCKGSVNLLTEFPILYFDCSINSPNKKELLKEIKINYKSKSEKLDLSVQGNINILNNKVNFKNLEMNNYKASVNDLKYFKNNFEKIIFDKSFFKMFDISKVRKFIIEIS